VKHYPLTSKVLADLATPVAAQSGAYAMVQSITGDRDMKLPTSFFERADIAQDAEAVRYIQTKHGAHSAADFFELDYGAASVARFAQYWRDQGLTDVQLLDRVVRRVLNRRLHPLQAMRISRVLHDLDDFELDAEDREVLIAQVFDLDWPKA